MRRGRPPVDTELVRTRLSRETLDALDTFSIAKLGKIDRPQALRQILKSWMTLCMAQDRPAGVLVLDDFLACDDVLRVLQ